MAPVAISLPVACDTDDKSVSKSVNEGASYFQLFDCEKKYTGLLNMFSQLVINNVDTDSKRKAVKVFVEGVKSICRENDMNCLVAKDVKQQPYSTFRYIVIRPDDAMDASISDVTVWYMVSDTAFATAKAFLEMSSDRPAVQEPVQSGPNCAAVKRVLHRAMSEGDVNKVVSILDANKWLSRDDVLSSHRFPLGRLSEAIIGDRVLLVDYLIGFFGLSKGEVCGAHCETASRAFKTGQLDMLKMLCIRFKLTEKEVCGGDNHALYAAALQGHLAAIQWVVQHFGLAGI